MTTLAERAKGTAFEVLYAAPKSKSEIDKAAQERERIRLKNARNNPKRYDLSHKAAKL